MCWVVCLFQQVGCAAPARLAAFEKGEVKLEDQRGRSGLGSVFRWTLDLRGAALVAFCADYCSTRCYLTSVYACLGPRVAYDCVAVGSTLACVRCGRTL